MEDLLGKKLTKKAKIKRFEFEPFIKMTEITDNYV